MKIISPLGITDSRLTSSTLAEDDAVAEWSAGTYTLGHQAWVASDHTVYEVAAASTTDEPTFGAAQDPATWFAVRPTNRWAAFDDRTGTKTELGSSAQYVITPGVRVNSLAFVNMSGITSINVSIFSATGGGVIYNETLSGQDFGNITDWYQWYFGEFRDRVKIAEFGIPNYIDNIITVTFTGSVDSSIGVFVIGSEIDLGLSMEGMEPDFVDYSRTEEDGFGGLKIQQRGFSNRLNITVGVQRANYDYVNNELRRLRTTPLVYVASQNFASGIIYGFHKRAPIPFTHGLSRLELQIEGLA